MKQELNKSIKKIVSYNKFLNNKPIVMGITLDDFIKQSEGLESFKKNFDSLNEILKYKDKKVNELLEKESTLTLDEQNLLDLHDMTEEKEISDLLTELQDEFRILSDNFILRTSGHMVTQTKSTTNIIYFKQQERR